MAQRPLKGLSHRQPDGCPRLSFLCPGSPFLLLTGSWHPSQMPSLALLCRGISRKALLPVCGEALPGWGYKDPRKGKPQTHHAKPRPTTVSPGREGEGTNTSPRGGPWPTDYLFPHTCWAPEWRHAPGRCRKEILCARTKPFARVYWPFGQIPASPPGLCLSPLLPQTGTLWRCPLSSCSQSRHPDTVRRPMNGENCPVSHAQAQSLPPT